MPAPKTEAEWRAQPGPWAHLTKEQTDDLIATMVAKEREECARVAEGWSTVSEGAHVITSGIAFDIRARANRQR